MTMILVTKADKGQVTVILDKNAYGIISDGMYRILNCTNGNLPRAYGLPKVHKAGFPLRIIVSALGSPLYNVASLLQKTLHSSIPEPKSHIKDSWSFARFINNKEIKDDEILISLDVTALFTNIPKDLVLKGIEKRWNHISKKTDLNLPQFLHAIDLILSSTSFSFNGEIYEQIFGSPMGSLLSPDAADIVMDDLETHCLSLLNCNIPIFIRYVDDIFAVVPKKSVGLILKIFNGYHPRLRFTYEIETNASLNFLDTTVIRNGNRLTTNWYRKPTFSGREHQGDIRKHTSNHSVVSEHRMSYGHDFDWGKPEILHQERHTRKRELAEMFFIKKFDGTINLQKDTENLNVLYEHIIKEL
ncbi:uncharacterized protein [Temnothorax longispinosus]|uniref:uncharacterized protein n=1 Tax=Temnothorax longispinosus TaxID=300112 RepID=UPI003A9A5FBB